MSAEGGAARADPQGRLFRDRRLPPLVAEAAIPLRAVPLTLAIRLP
jgi:hypothetical protein